MEEIKRYWNEHPCSIQQDIEEESKRRYRLMPEIPVFADFQSAQGLKVLEIGTGIGIDFLNWLQAGADATGIDISEVSLNRARERVSKAGFNTSCLMLADAQKLPFPDDSFDIVYSSGVLHHVPDTVNAVREFMRVLRPGGKGKLLVYNRHSVLSLLCWFLWAPLKFRPFQSLRKVIAEHMESPGTKAYTEQELRIVLTECGGADIKINRRVWQYDYSGDKFGLFLRVFIFILINVLGKESAGWFMTAEFTKLREAGN